MSVMFSSTARADGVDPLALFARSPAPDRFLWIAPDGLTLCAFGRVWSAEATGSGRFSEVGRRWAELCGEAVVEGDGPLRSPVAVGGFAFEDAGARNGLWTGFPSAQLLLPKVLAVVRGDEAWLTVNVPGDPAAARERAATLRAAVLDAPSLVGAALEPSAVTLHEERSARQWMDAVRAVVEDARRGEVEKVVLAREVRVTADRPFVLGTVLRRLRRDNPGCYVFAVASGDRCFLGATPERLVRLRDGVALATALAGSAPRGANGDEEERLAQALRRSAKDGVEHRIVVDALRDGLVELAGEVVVDEPTDVVRLAHVQHLRTTLRARVREGTTVLDLLARLQPSPAVGGMPREAALRIIRTREDLDRGWYGGSVGWIDAKGEGEFAVAIRSALVHGDAATLFAGCGIVADSDAESEYAESSLKLRPMLAALEGAQ